MHPALFALGPRVTRLVRVCRKHPHHERGELLHRREMRGLVGHDMLNPPAELPLLRLRVRMELHDKGSVGCEIRFFVFQLTPRSTPHYYGGPAAGAARRAGSSAG